MKIETKENQSMVAQLREIRDRMSFEIQDMTPEQVIGYYNFKKGLLPKEVWAKAKEQQNSGFEKQQR